MLTAFYFHYLTVKHALEGVGVENHFSNSTTNSTLKNPYLFSLKGTTYGFYQSKARATRNFGSVDEVSILSQQILVALFLETIFFSKIVDLTSNVSSQYLTCITLFGKMLQLKAMRNNLMHMTTTFQLQVARNVR